jgi:hypothetical protein
VATIGADDTYKPQSATFTIGDETITGGLQGATNPKDADGLVPANSLNPAASGAFLVFEAKADGFLYVLHKASSNKAYTVFEEGTAISYTYAAIGDASTDLCAVYEFTLPYEVENEQFVVKNSIEFAEQEFLKITAPEKYAAHWTEAEDGTKSWSPIKVNGLGVIKFPVYKDCKYIVNANGSKITAAGFAFSTIDDLTISSEDVVIMGNGTPAPKVKRGDANGDDVVNAADIGEIVNSIMGAPSEKFNEANADANGDGVVNAADIVAVVNMIMSTDAARPAKIEKARLRVTQQTM